MDAFEYFDLFTSRKMPFILDEPRLAGFVEQQGFRVVAFDEYDFVDPKAETHFVLLTRPDCHERMMTFWEKTTGISTHLALSKFDTSLASLEYSLKHFLSVDFVDTVKRRAACYDAMLSCDSVDIITRAGSMQCKFREEVEVANADIQMEPGWLYAVSEFFESSIVNLAAPQSSYTLNGDFAFDGMVYLCNNPDLKERWGKEMDDLLRLAQTGNNVATLADDQVMRLVVGGVDKSDVLAAMTTGNERERATTEFAMGCVRYPNAQDWSINSVMHEGSDGVHVGIGMGKQIPHIDFIAKGAERKYHAIENKS
jgi:hypothetical protein